MSIEKLVEHLKAMPPDQLQYVMSEVSSGMFARSREADSVGDQRSGNFSFAGACFRMIADTMEKTPNEPMVSQRRKAA